MSTQGQSWEFSRQLGSAALTVPPSKKQQDKDWGSSSGYLRTGCLHGEPRGGSSNALCPSDGQICPAGANPGRGGGKNTEPGRRRQAGIWWHESMSLLHGLQEFSGLTGCRQS